MALMQRNLAMHPFAREPARRVKGRHGGLIARAFKRQDHARSAGLRRGALREQVDAPEHIPGGLQLPSAVDLEGTEAEPGLRGDTASGGGNKPATLETGATVQVPLFVSVGDRVRVDTRTGKYVSRA